MHRAALDACHVATLCACSGHACFLGVSTLLITTLAVYYVMFPYRAVFRDETYMRSLKNVVYGEYIRHKHIFQYIHVYILQGKHEVHVDQVK